MRIDFECSGGLYAARLECHLNTEELSAERRRELEGLVAESRALELTEQDLNPSSGAERDVFSYRLTLSAGGRRNTLEVNDVTAPASLHPLLARLRELATQERLRQ